MSTRVKSAVENVIKRGRMSEVVEAFITGQSVTDLFRESSGWFKGKKGKFRRALIAALGGKEKYAEISARHAGSRQLFGGKRRARGPAVLIDDSGVKHIRGSKIRWMISGVAYENMLQNYREYKRRLASDEKMPRGTRTAMRDVVKSIRPTVRADRTGCWSREHFYEPIVVHIKGSKKNGEGGGKMNWRKLVAVIYVSPKGNRYVEARANEKATLIIDYPDSDFRKHLRLRRFEGSGIEQRYNREKEMIERGKKSLRETRKRKREARRARKGRKR